MKLFKKVKLIGAAASILCALTGCGGNVDADTIQFWVYGSNRQLEMYKTLINAFNEGYGKEHNIKAKITVKVNGTYETAIMYTANSAVGPDVIIVHDADFKKYAVAKYFTDIQQELDNVTDIDISDIMPNLINRFRYNIETNTSNETDPLYALPFEGQPTALFYNESMLKDAGIICISVDEDKMDDWNDNLIADNLGHKKSDFEKLNDIRVPKKGFFRSESPYVSGDVWAKYGDEEIMVFNNRIAMNWDEIEDISSIFSASTNPSKTKEGATDFGTVYGYFTENWFNYGWSVGGDCLRDLTGNGDWNFSLLDPSPNFVVMKGSYTGQSGKVYHVGDILDFQDKMDVKFDDGVPEMVVAREDGKYNHSTNHGGGEVKLLESLSGEENLEEIPSTREAFTRYLKLGATKTSDIDGEPGLDISPNPNTFSTRSATNYFYSGKLAFCLQAAPYADEVGKYAQFDWGVCPLARYKEYVDPYDPYCDEVRAIGKLAGHSDTISLGVREMSQHRQEAATLIKWLASREAQEIRTSLGFFPNQKDLANLISEEQLGYKCINYQCFNESLEFESPGDWWYMPDYDWVHKWCLSLNSEVRNGKKTYAEWAPVAIRDTNASLAEYKNYRRN